jgi:hypothetical protein
MRRALGVSLAAAMIAAPLVLASGLASVSAAPVRPAAASATKVSGPMNATIKIAGRQHWCGTNGVECAEPGLNWDEYRGWDQAKADGAKFFGYVGHDEPATLFYSNKAGSGNNVTFQMVLPKDPPTRPQQDGSGGTDNFQLHPTFWIGMVMCDSQGSPNPDGTALTGHATVPCKPDSNSNIYESSDPKSSHYMGLGPGQAYEEMQFYPPGWVNWPAGNGCSATQYCAAMNIDTFSENDNTGQFDNTACLNTVGPEPVNFAFITKNGKATAPANPGAPQHFVPNLKRDLLMNPGDHITVHLFDTANGLRIVITDHTSHTSGFMTASTASGFGNVVFAPNAKKCTIQPYDFHPEFSTSTPATRNVSAAHTYNVAFSDEIGHFEYCGKVGTDANATCLDPLGADTNDGDTAGPDPAGDDDFCLPGKDSTLVKIGGCLDIDGDFDGVPYNFNWPGSVSSPLADHLLHPTSFEFTSPTTAGKNFSWMSFESDISRDESSDTSFRVDVPCQRHLTNPADPHPGTGCVNPPPNSVFYPFYSTRNAPQGCLWQFGGRYIPGTTNKFGGSAHAEFGPLLAVSYPSSPFGTITKRLNDFRNILPTLPCRTKG